MAEDQILTEGTSDTDGNVEQRSDRGSSGEKKEQAVPYTRFKEVNDGLAEFKKLGRTPSELAQEIQDYHELIGALKEQAVEGDSAPKEKSKLSAEKQAEIKAELELLFPGLSKLNELEKKVDVAHTAADVAGRSHISGLQNKASEMVTKLVTDTGYPKEAAAEIETLVANMVYGDKYMQQKFLTGDLSVVTDAFKQIDDSFLSKHMIKSPKLSKGKGLPSLLSGSQGLSLEGKGKSEEVLTEEKLNKMPLQERKRAIGKDAFAYYTALANARAAAEAE